MRSPPTAALTLTWVLILVIGRSEGILDVIYHSLVRYYTDDLVEIILGPASKIAFGGPTVAVATALSQATPFLYPSVLGERFDQFVFTTGGWLLGFLINVIATIIFQVVTWSIETLLLIVQGVLLFFDAIINKKRELPGGGLSGMISALQTPRDDEPILSREGRLLTHGDRNSIGSVPGLGVSSLLTENPQLRKFAALISKGEEECLEELICSIFAAPDAAVTKEELHLKTQIAGLMAKTNINNSSSSVAGRLEDASKVGRRAKSQAKCQRNYPKCSHPLLFRAIYVHVQRVIRSVDQIALNLNKS